MIETTDLYDYVMYNLPEKEGDDDFTRGYNFAHAELREILQAWGRDAMQENFIAQYVDTQDDKRLFLLDFVQLYCAYKESDFLRSPEKKFTRRASWIVRNYEHIIGGKYRNYERNEHDIAYLKTPPTRIETDRSAEELNEAFQKLNEDL